MRDATRSAKQHAGYPTPRSRGVVTERREFRLTRHPGYRALSVLGSLVVLLIVGGFLYLIVRVTPPGPNPVVVIASVIGGLVVLTQVFFLDRALSIRTLRVVDGRVVRVTTVLGIPRTRRYPPTARFALERQAVYPNPHSAPYTERVLFARDGEQTFRVASCRITGNLRDAVRWLGDHAPEGARDASRGAPIDG